MNMSKSERATLRKELMKLGVPGEAVEGDEKLAFQRMGGATENRIFSGEFNWARLAISFQMTNVVRSGVKILGYSIWAKWDDVGLEVDEPDATPPGALNRCVLREGFLRPHYAFDGILYARLAGPIPVHLRKCKLLPVTVRVHLADDSDEDYETWIAVEYKPTAVTLPGRKGGRLFDEQGPELRVSMVPSSDAPQEPDHVLNKSVPAEPKDNTSHLSKF